VTDVVEETFGDLTVRIDRTLCVGFGDCVDEAQDVFAMDEEDIVVFKDGCPTVDRATLVRACEICPVDALELLDNTGKKLAP
jgi:ferredoxin